MPPAADENHPALGIPDEPEDAEGEESDEYDIEVGDCGLFQRHSILPLNTMVVLSKDDDDYAGEDDEEEGEQNGVSARLVPPLISHMMY
jgi:hypothetical protein